MSVRRASYSDIVQVAKLHKKQFKDHFLGKYSLGLIRKFYEPYLDSCIFLVSDDGEINGFIMGGRAIDLNAAKHKFLNENKLKYIIETLARPSIYIKAANRVKLFKRAKATVTNEKSPIRLLSIAVNEKVKGTGVALKLLQEFEKNVGMESYGLSVKKNNERAIHFYYKNGFELTASEKEGLYFDKKLKGE